MYNVGVHVGTNVVLQSFEVGCQTSKKSLTILLQRLSSFFSCDKNIRNDKNKFCLNYFLTGGVKQFSDENVFFCSRVRTLKNVTKE